MAVLNLLVENIDSNTTLVKVKSLPIISTFCTPLIQIQHLLKLNVDKKNGVYQFMINSNTTLVKVKLEEFVGDK